MDETGCEVWATVQALNRCWTCGDLGQLERLRDFFHERMVAITPGDRLRLTGRQTCIAGWSNFAKTVAIDQWREHDPQVTVFGDTAVVTYFYELRGETGGAPVSFTGRDMMTLIRQHGRWHVIADQFSPFPSNP